MNSTLTKNQKKSIRKDIEINGEPVTLIAQVRYDDSCGNGHNSFAITCDSYEHFRQRGEPTVKHESGKTLWLSSCGCQHDVIREHFPEIAHLIRWHLCSSDGPMHYIANTIYHADDRDHHRLREGETRQIRNGKTGLPAWQLVALDAAGNEQDIYELDRYIDAEEPPECPYTLAYVPWLRVGEGKNRDLDAARECALWPDATDDDLTAPGLRERLQARLPALLEDFRRDVEAFGFEW